MKRIAFCLFSVLSIYPAVAQQTDNDPLHELKQRFQKSQFKQPEKIHLHTDRTVYASADTVWFKAYLADAYTHTLHPVQEVFYLDLISEKNTVILSQRLQTENGYKAGSFTLPDSLKTGNYLLQTYTNWQRNTGPESFFRQVIYVNKVPQSSAKTVGISFEKVPANLQFFPEGGKLMAGFESRVGFKAVSANGAIIPVAGKIIDESGKIVTSFRSNNSCAGSFLFRPVAGKTYRAQISEGADKKEFALPVPEKRYALSLKNSPDSVTVLMAASENLSAPLYLVLQSHGQLISADSVKFNANGLRKRTFKTGNWPEGIMQVSLLNENQQPENDRLFFHRKPKQLTIKLETAKKIYGRREPVQLNLAITDQAGKPVETELSVAVTNNLPNLAPTLRQSLLSPSIASKNGLTGLTEPENYDDQLLTQMAPNFSREVFSDNKKEAPEYLRETELNQSALVLENNLPVGNSVIYFLEINSGKTYLVSSNAEGRFKIPAEGSRFFYQVWQNGALKRDAKLQLLRSANVTLPENWRASVATDSAQTKQFNLRRQIDMMYEREPETPKVNLVNKDMWPAYPADKYYPLVEYNELNNMEEILREMVPAVRIITRNKQVQANMYDEDRRIFFPHQPLYIIDGQPTWNSDLFLRLDASQLEQVNIYNSDKTLKNFGFMGNQGVIVVFTKSRNYQNADLRRENILNVPGQFEATQYKAKAIPANVPDFRPTVYWDPKIQTNPDGKTTITFPTTDETGNLKVRVQGITPDGQVISEELLIPVQPAG